MDSRKQRFFPNKHINLHSPTYLLQTESMSYLFDSPWNSRFTDSRAYRLPKPVYSSKKRLWERVLKKFLIGWMEDFFLILNYNFFVLISGIPCFIAVTGCIGERNITGFCGTYFEFLVVGKQPFSSDWRFPYSSIYSYKN